MINRFTDSITWPQAKPRIEANIDKLLQKLVELLPYNHDAACTLQQLAIVDQIVTQKGSSNA